MTFRIWILSGRSGMILTHSFIHLITKNRNKMNLKRIFGAILTLLGIASLIYTAVMFTNSPGGSHAVKTLIIFGILGLIFFIAGIGLIRTTKDES
jgi:uncharacterized membrane protein